MICDALRHFVSKWTMLARLGLKLAVFGTTGSLESASSIARWMTCLALKEGTFVSSWVGRTSRGPASGMGRQTEYSWNRPITSTNWRNMQISCHDTLKADVTL